MGIGVSKLPGKHAVKPEAPVPRRRRQMDVAVFGPKGVGKTALCRVAAGDARPLRTAPTIGAEAALARRDQRRILLFDLSGDPRFQRFNTSYVSRASVLVLAFDVSRRSTLDEAAAATMAFGPQRQPLVVVGTKADDVGLQREVSMAEAEDFARSLGAPYVETSAKHGVNVEVLLDLLDAIGERLAEAVDTPQGLR